MVQNLNGYEIRKCYREIEWLGGGSQAAQLVGCREALLRPLVVPQRARDVQAPREVDVIIAVQVVHVVDFRS